MVELQSGMERASKLIRRMKLPGGTMTPEEMACTVWEDAVGKRIASHARASRLVRSRLVVEVEDAVWRVQLMSLQGHILRNLAKNLGPGAVEELEFRVMPPRRGPQREVRPMALGMDGAPVVDDADAIADPVLRGIYKASRKKALA